MEKNVTVARRLLCSWDSPGKNTGVSCHFLLQWIFLTQGWKLCFLQLLNCRQILYLLSHQGSLKQCEVVLFGKVGKV